MADLFDKPFRAIAIVPAEFRLPVEKVKLPHQRQFELMHVATDSTTGELLLIALADTQAGVDEFLSDYGNPRTIPNLNALGRRGDWRMNMFPDEDDGVSDFVTLVRKGWARMRRADEDRMYRRKVAERVMELDRQEQERKRRANEQMYKGDKT